MGFLVSHELRLAGEGQAAQVVDRSHIAAPFHPGLAQLAAVEGVGGEDLVEHRLEPSHLAGHNGVPVSTFQVSVEVEHFHSVSSSVFGQ
ncbi:MAG: hypothetical protein Q9O62_00035 [Ardenticatenia bacterium]|nr:hypothetical protein [Ardenticatenia bacterium]